MVVGVYIKKQTPTSMFHYNQLNRIHRQEFYSKVCQDKMARRLVHVRPVCSANNGALFATLHTIVRIPPPPSRLITMAEFTIDSLKSPSC